MDRDSLSSRAASRGIGAAIAEAAAGAGYAVLLSYASDARSAQQVVARIRDAGGVAEAVQADCGEAAGVAALFAAADRMGPLRALAYNAGITGISSALVDADPAQIERVIAVTHGRDPVRARSGAGGCPPHACGPAARSCCFITRPAYGSRASTCGTQPSKGGMTASARPGARSRGDRHSGQAVSPGPVATACWARRSVRATGYRPLGGLASRPRSPPRCVPGSEQARCDRGQPGGFRGR